MIIVSRTSSQSSVHRALQWSEVLEKCRTSLQKRQRYILYIASRSSEKCNYCQSLWIKASPNVNVCGNGMPLCPRTLSSQEGKAICTDHEHKSLRVIKRFSSFASNALNLEGILTLIPWTHSRAFVCSCGLCNLECLEPLGCLTVARLQGSSLWARWFAMKRQCFVFIYRL